MVLLHYGVDIAESNLRQACDCTLLGTDALQAVRTARELGFVKSGKYTLTLAELRHTVTCGLFPIVFVSLWPIDARPDMHAVIVTGFAEQTVVVLDPLFGERHLPDETFQTAWALSHHVTLIIER